MKVSDAIWMAMACAASASALIRPMRKVAALKIHTSKTSVAAIGRPIRQMWRKRGQSGRHRRPNR